MYSILIPSFNNFPYLKICIESIEKNSKYNHQIIVHVNQGADETLKYLNEKNIEYSFSKENIGMPRALNNAAKLAKYNYLVISHDDFYYCPDWDTEFENEIKNLKHNNFYLSGTMVNAVDKVKFDPSKSPPVFNAGKTSDTFNENKVLKNLNLFKTFNFQGSTKHPAIVHKDTWNKVGGWSEEFFPTGGDDTDFLMKLWSINIRIFKGLGRCSVYHFGSITTRKKDKKIFTYLGSKANKIFLKKWKISINFFENFYLRSGLDKNKNLIFKKYDGPLKDPEKNLKYFYEIIKNKINLIYLYLINYKV